MKVRIDIDTNTFVRFWLVVIGFAFAIFMIYMARTGLIVVAGAAFLALALSGPVNLLRKYIPGRSRIGATAVAFLSIIAIIGMFLVLIVPPVIEQTAKVVDSTPQLIDNASRQWEGIGNLIEKYHLESQVDQAVASVKDNSSAWLSNTGQNLISSVGSVFSTLAMLFLGLVLTFLILVEGPTWMKRIWGLYRDPELMESHRKLATKMQHVVAGYVTGQLTVSGIGALCAGATVFILSLFIPDVPANLALPTIAVAFLLSLIPMFGATIAGILVSLLLAINSVAAGIIFAIYFIVYQQIENNFISPSIQSKYVELSPLAVLVAVTLGLYLFGLLGGIISIPIAGCIKVLIENYLEHSRKKRAKSRKPLGRLIKKLEEEIET